MVYFASSTCNYISASTTNCIIDYSYLSDIVFGLALILFFNVCFYSFIIFNHNARDL